MVFDLARSRVPERPDVGIDLDRESIAEARANARAAGVASRARFEVRDVASLGDGERYDLACIFDALHDMARPVEGLRAVRGALAPGGSLLLASERVADAFEAPSDVVERFRYAWNVLRRLPATRAEGAFAEPVSVLPASKVQEYARAPASSESRHRR